MATNRVFDTTTFDQENLTCSSCGWSGTGRETKIIDLYGIGKNREVHCPSCDAYIGALPVENDPLGDSGSQLGFQVG